jgi:hypothetical protein
MQHGITRLGTQVRLPDGRAATVVYNSLVGVGVKFGLHDPPPEAFAGTDGNTFQDGRTEGFEWEPEALLRAPEMAERLGMPCVCDDSEVEITRIGLPANNSLDRPAASAGTVGGVVVP